MTSPADLSTATRRIRLLISGRVQGVGYRASVVDEAEALGLRGWVRNLRGGEVELCAEGAAGAVEALLRWCHRGPPGARVTAVEVHEEEPAGEPAGFRVRPTA